MEINTLELTDFGMFHNFKITLNGRDQLIYGDNEQGKTTIMGFVLLMLYGDQGRDRADHMTIRTKYQPWNSNEMAGSMEFTNRDVRYRVEKRFGKTTSKDVVTLINLDTDQEVSLGRKQEVGEWALGINLDGFLKTGFIGRPGMFKSDPAKDELTEQLVKNLTESGDESVSSNTVVTRLDNALTLLRTKSGRKGQLVEAQDHLQHVKEEYQSVKQQVNDQAQAVTELKQLTAQREQQDDIKKKLAADTLAQEADQRKKLLQGIQVIHEKEAALTRFGVRPDNAAQVIQGGTRAIAQARDDSRTADAQASTDGEQGVPISEDEYTQTKQLNEQANQMSKLQEQFARDVVPAGEETLKQAGRLSNLQAQQKALQAQADSFADAETQNKNLSAQKEKNTSKQQTLATQIAAMEQQREQEQAAVQSGQKQKQAYLIGGMILLLVGVVLGVVVNVFGYVLAAVGAAAVILGFGKAKQGQPTVSAADIDQQKQALAALTETQNTIDQKLAALVPKLKEAEQKREQLRNIAAQITPIQENVSDSLNRWRAARDAWQDRVNQVPELELPTLGLSQDSLDEITAVLAKQHDVVAAALSQNLQVKQVLDFMTYQVSYRLQQKAQTRQEQLAAVQAKAKKSMEAMLDYFTAITPRPESLTDAQTTLTAIQDAWADYQKAAQAVASQRQVTGIKDSEEVLRASVQHDTAPQTLSDEERAQLQTQLKEMPADLDAQWYRLQNTIKVPSRPLDEIESDISDTEENIQDLQARYDALSTALMTLQEVIDERRQNFAPELKKKAGEYLAQLTNKRYHDLLIPKSFELKVLTDGAYHDYNYLSGGTTDQAYLALRFAIANLLAAGKEQGEEIPMLLDDVLREYDNRRAEAALQFLKAQGAQHQLIMFTCHQHITEMAEDLGIATTALETQLV
ncbi:AAA family ATPase [Schleiferilactobacillus shenzhenensis]|uniref:Rad50/SbcC-type AAA domain-containing protein n=1 Tax=Schleiferilactobacillus shenzhenensis LY-73 TaxID=1231336 RepID=U4TQS4_9LACO|nr:AAA family ATPase [Schleiferilactobacillus shenzhenensis]ERL65795.1 hypothetical protein L248_1871 [Schleiferilactobacillus shenzhenensis LY-73]